MNYPSTNPSLPLGKLKILLKDISTLAPLSYLNLTLVPLMGEGHEPLSYILGKDALKKKLISIEEKDTYGDINEILVINKSNKMVLLIDGEELIGAKQNRILNTSVMIPPKSNVPVPVSCVEEGRWMYKSKHFYEGDLAPSKLRARTCRAVYEGLNLTRAFEADQAEIWDTVAEYANKLNAEEVSSTMAMHEIIKTKTPNTKDYIKHLPYPENACGVIAYINNQFAGLDLFDKPTTLKTMWKKLIKGYAIDALVLATQYKHKDENSSITDNAKNLLKHLKTLSAKIYPAIGTGQDWRFKSKGYSGHALVVENTCIHLSVFPEEEIYYRKSR